MKENRTSRKGKIVNNNHKHCFEKRIKFLSAITFTAIIVISSYMIAHMLRYDGQIPQLQIYHSFLVIPFLVVIKISIFWMMGTFNGWWRYVSLPDAIAILKTNLASSFLILVYYEIYFSTYFRVPYSVFALDCLICFTMMIGSRVFARIVREKLSQNSKEKGELPGKVIIVGAGAAGQTIAREIRENPHLNMEILGFLDNDMQRVEQKFQGIPVLGSPLDLERIYGSRKIDMLIIAQHAVSRKELLTVLEACRKLEVKSKILPSVGEIINEAVSISHVRDVRVEDLLGRKPIHLDAGKISRYLEGKSVLITGAGGSIGSEICRQVIHFNPERMILLDNAETPLFKIENELRALSGGTQLIASLSDVRDLQKIRSVFASTRPEVVFHAAAYKHVPMLEIHPAEAVSTNVLGTRNLADCAHMSSVERFVMVSTDKAVNPVNVMGASKRAAEIYVQYLARNSSTNFSTVRFGNVLGSNGSVIPIFKEQIEKGGPLTVTHREVVRFFMTIPEAAQLVLQAGGMGKGGEIFLLDMGEPIRILDLAEELIRLSGLRPYEDIDIVFTGLRPGEKLFEELLLSGEDIITTSHEKIFVAKSIHVEDTMLLQWLDEIPNYLHVMDSQSFVSMLKKIVPEYLNSDHETYSANLSPAYMSLKN